MTEAALTIPFTGSAGQRSSAGRIFVHLEQVEHNEQQDTVSMYDISQMVMRARNGTPAKTYKAPGCAAYIEEGTLVANFDFYAWPSSPDLIYAITVGMGNVTNPVIIQKDIDFSVTFELSDVVEFDFILEEMTDYEWETECYDNQGRVVDDVELEMDGYTTLRASAPVFGVVRIKGVKRGALHTLTTRLVKTMETPPDEDEFDDSAAGRYYTYADFMGMFFHYSRIDTWENEDGNQQSTDQEPVNLTGLKLTNLRISATAHWMDGDEKVDQIIMEVPGCMKDLLESCGTDTNGDGIIDTWDEDAILNTDDDHKICGGGNEPPYNVYVSGCTGEVLLAVRPEDDENSWCGGDN